MFGRCTVPVDDGKSHVSLLSRQREDTLVCFLSISQHLTCELMSAPSLTRFSTSETYPLMAAKWRQLCPVKVNKK